MDTTRYTHLKEGKLYDLRCALVIRKLLKKYHYMYLVIENQSESDEWEVFSVRNYMRMHFRKGDEMVLYAYGEDKGEEEQILEDICERIKENC